MSKIAMTPGPCLLGLLGLLGLWACGDTHGTAPDGGVDGAIDGPVENLCADPVGDGTVHDDHITADETWTAAGSPHRVPATLRIEGGATLTLEPCATVQLGEAVRLRLGAFEPGGLVARGEASRPIVLEPLAPATRWGGIEVMGPGTADLAHVTLRRGASPTDSNMPAALVVRGDDNLTAALAQVRVEDVRIEEPGSLGVHATAAGGFTPDSHDLTITGAGGDPYDAARTDNRQPVYAEPLSMQTLPTGSYTGNDRDVLLVHIRGSAQGDLRLRDLGVPYRFDSRLTLYAPDGQIVTFTLDPGVTLQMAQGGGILLDNVGASGGVRVVANGTASAPITITSSSATPAPGDWNLIDWEAGATGSLLRHVVVEYGGGDSGHLGYGCGPTDSDALLIIHNWVPQAGLIQSSTFRHSASGAITSGWQVPEQLPDLSTGNTFQGIAGPCAVSVPSDGTYCASDVQPQCFVAAAP